MLMDAAGVTGCCCALLPLVLSSGADVDAMGAVQSGLPRSQQRFSTLLFGHFGFGSSCAGVCFIVSSGRCSCDHRKTGCRQSFKF